MNATLKVFLKGGIDGLTVIDLTHCIAEGTVLENCLKYIGYNGVQFAYENLPELTKDELWNINCALNSFMSNNETIYIYMTTSEDDMYDLGLDEYEPNTAVGFYINDEYHHRHKVLVDHISTPLITVVAHLLCGNKCM